MAAADQYDSDQIEVVYDGERIEQVMSVDPPEESYDRSYEQTLGDDGNVLQQDRDPELEGELVVAPTSGSIASLDEALSEGTQASLTVRYPDDDVRDNKRFTDAVLTDGSDDSFDGDSVPTRSYSFIADQINE